MRILTVILPIIFFISCANRVNNSGDPLKVKPKMDEKRKEALKKSLSPAEYNVIVNKGTERPHTSEFNSKWDSGTYVCKSCGVDLFNSTTKFDAHCGWPSFYEAANKENVEEVLDSSHGMTRVEVVCKNCKAHLGHVFNDGPTDKTGLRYCINGVSLGFEPKDTASKN